MSLITKTVGSAQGRDYATWQDAIDSIPKDLVADGNSYDVVGCSDSEFTSTTGQVISITGFTCDNDHKIKLRAAAGQSWRDFSGIQTVPLRYEPQHGVSLSATGTYSKVIYSDADFLEIDGLQVKGESYSLRTFDLRGNNCKVTNTIIDGRPGDYLFFCTGSRVLVDNVVLINRQPNTVGMGIGDGSLVVNSTIVMASEYAGTHGIVNFGGTGPSAESVVKNTAIFGYASSLTNYFTGSNNATDAPDYSNSAGAITNSLAGLTKADQFMDLTLAGMDLRTKVGSALIDAGAPVANTMSANGIARPSGAGFDIGAWEFVVPATTINAAIASAGYVGHASAISITTNGSITSNIVVTPSDGGAGGTFNPTTLMLTPAAASGTIEYTATAAGNVSISVTNNGGLANPAAAAFSATVKAPSGTVTNQPAPDGQNLVVTFSTDDGPTSGMATLTPATANPAGASTTSGVVQLTSGAGTATFTAIPPGNYNLVITVSSSAGTGSVSGTQAISIIGISGNPQAENGEGTPDPGGGTGGGGTTPPATRSLTITLDNLDLTPAANLSGLRWAWFDQATPNLFAAPTDHGTTESTNGAGQLVIPLPNSAMQVGGIGWLIITNSTGNPALTHSAFSGPVAVE